MRKTIFWSVAGVAVIVLFGCTPPETTVERYDLVVQGGRVMDPESGLDEVRNLGIRDGRIAEISTSTLVGERTVVATDLVVAPGFIDLHAHGQSEEAFRLMAQDGVTTAFELEVGTADVSAWYREEAGMTFMRTGMCPMLTP